MDILHQRIDRLIGSMIGADRVIRLEIALLPDDTPFIAAYDEKEDLVVEGRVTRSGVPMVWSRREVERPRGEDQDKSDTPRARQMSHLAETADRVVVHVPMTFRLRGGRKQIIVPEGERNPWSDRPSTPPHPLLTALARAHRWQRLMEEGTFASLTELADSLGVQRTYVARVMNLTGLAPDIVERMLAGNEPDGATLRILHEEIPVDWLAWISTEGGSPNIDAGPKGSAALSG